MRILLVGEHPQGTSGNSHMMAGVIQQIDLSKHSVTVFAAGGSQNNWLWPMDQRIRIVQGLEVAMDANGNPTKYDIWGANRLIEHIKGTPYDLFVTVGIDIWRYAHVFREINRVRLNNRFRTGAILPYDLPYIRNDWVGWMGFFDYPFIYSKFGYELLRPRLPKARYFRPKLFGAEEYKPVSKEEKDHYRRMFFPGLSPDMLIFGFVGKNQIRKDPQRLIKAFMMAKRQYPKMLLYLHMELEGVFNLRQIMQDYGGQTGDFVMMPPGTAFDTKRMVGLYNTFHCLVNCTMNEGLSWTVVEGQLCGIPCIASETTAQTELLEGGGGILVPSKETAYLPVISENGPTWVETQACDPTLIASAIIRMAKDRDFHASASKLALESGQKWVAGASDFDKEFLSVVDVKVHDNAILFVQHSAAGDVFMTTKALAGLKKRHSGAVLVYMTQKKYFDILKGNPNVDEIIEYNEGQMARYQTVYNPHGDRILPGHWGRNSNSLLSDFYWKILEVEKGDFYIGTAKPRDALIAKTPFVDGEKPIAVVHTTGGDPKFRTYKFMDVVCKALAEKGYFTVQLGAGSDYPAEAMLDLRGALSFRESAWIMKRASIAVTVDSFISHLAGALGVSQVCLFGSGNHNVVKPEQVSGKLVCLVPDYIRYCPGLGPCSGSVRDCPHPCTGIHDPKTILSAIEEIEREEQ